MENQAVLFLLRWDTEGIFSRNTSMIEIQFKGIMWEKARRV